jgi:tRNA/tmRNA/rRNA uracil-C5-methylase (TrmA/RlmC/RlmD family)
MNSSLTKFCAYLNQCGGCLQDAGDRLESWRTLFKDEDWHFEVPASARKLDWITLTAQEEGFRGRVQLRGRLDQDGRIRLGYFARGGQIFVGINDCPAAESAIRKLVRTISDEQTQIVGSSRFRLQIIGLSEDQVYVTLMSGHELQSPELGHLRAKICGIEGLRVAFAENEVEAQHQLKWDEDDGISYYVGGQSFCQSNKALNRKLRQHVFNQVKHIDPDRVIDAYAGNGNLSLRLAANSYEVVAVENSPTSIRAMMRAAQEVDCAGMLQVIASDLDLEKLRPRFSSRSLLIVDPPRVGMVLQAGMIAHLPIENLIYISCSKNAFVSDWQIIRPHFSLIAAHAFDMFPRQEEVEMVLTLRRRTNISAQHSPA